MTKQVLIVEDEGIIAADIEECLVRKGFHIAGVADSGIKAIEIAQGTTPDVVLMDVKLTGSMDGIQAAIKMRSASARSTPVVFVTAALEGAFPHLTMLGRYVYLHKPFSEEELLKALEQALTLHEGPS